MFSKPLDQIMFADITALTENCVQEGRTLEFKQALPGSTDKEKKEFLADVSSFANAGGGNLVFGIEETGGVAMAVPGLAGFDEDKEFLRLESTIRDGIKPRIPGIQLRTVGAGKNCPVLILRIPRSWTGPHMVTYKGGSKFFSRSSNGKFQMDVTELRFAFESAAEIPARVARWRDERLGRIIANEGPMRVGSGTCMVMHLIPFESISNEWRLSGTELAKASVPFHPIGTSGWDHRLNIDGLLTFSTHREDENTAESFTQLYRSGRIEAVVEGFLFESDKKRILGSVWFERNLIKHTEDYLKGLGALDIQPPFAFLLAMTGMKGAEMGIGGHRVDPYLMPVNRDLLIFPDVRIESWEYDLKCLLRPVFDSVWNAFGYKQSMNYDAEGNWKPK